MKLQDLLRQEGIELTAGDLILLCAEDTANRQRKGITTSFSDAELVLGRIRIGQKVSPQSIREAGIVACRDGISANRELKRITAAIEAECYEPGVSVDRMTPTVIVVRIWRQD